MTCRVFDASNQGLRLVPSTIAQLAPGTVFLAVDNNVLTRLPDEIVHLRMLETLRAEGNLLSKLPDGIESMTNLRRLYLGSNALTEIPAGLWLSPKLTVLVVAGNSLNDGALPASRPAAVGELAPLRILSLGGEGITVLPDWIGEFSTLETLDVAHSSLTQLPDAINNLHALRALNVRWGLLRDANVDCLVNLESMRLDHNRLTRVPGQWGVTDARRFPKLEQLFLDHNDISSVYEWFGGEPPHISGQ